MKFKSLSLYFHTLRHLRFSQLYGQIAGKFQRRVSVDGKTPALREKSRDWIQGAPKNAGMVGPSTFYFLNRQGAVETKEDWNNPEKEKLWLYNLHYFEFLNSPETPDSGSWKPQMIRRWILENPPCEGNGWEPYPVSLRIYNWIRWLWEGNQPVEGMLDSLAQQSRYLIQRLETHILANHYMINGKALVFAGLFFDGPEADEWLRSGLAILSGEYEEQVLADGAHYERSPMYHSLLTEDTLDICNLMNMFSMSRLDEIGKVCRRSAEKMLDWLQVMTFRDGTFPLFNDAALGIAAPARELLDYSKRLGIHLRPTTRGSRVLRESGFARMEIGTATLFANVGTMSPAYQPGHSHADALSFEFMLGNRKLLVDTGVGTYEIGSERARQRSTTAHNTLTVNNQSSSQVWASFRVARRARVQIDDWQFDEDIAVLKSSHDGFAHLRGMGRHCRTWSMKSQCVELSDRVLGSEKVTIDWRLHFAPGWRILLGEDSVAVVCEDTGKVIGTINYSPLMKYSVEETKIFEEFGKPRDCQVLIGKWVGRLPFVVQHSINWRDGLDG